MSSWACQSGAWNTDDCATTPGATFSEPVTFNVYAVDPGPTVGSLLETKTQTFNIPYRPSASGICTGAQAGEWFNGADSSCYNGFLNTIQFDMSNATGAGTQLPSQVIWSVQYDTSQYGPNPYGSLPCETSAAGCPYDSLNVGLESAANTGTAIDPNGVFQNAALAGDYCDGGTGGVNVFRADTPCWTGYIPMASLQLYPATAPVISAAAVTVPEGNSGAHNVTVPVTLDHPYSHTVTVQWHTQAQSAAAGSDFTSASGTLSFAPGQTTPTSPIQVSVIGDTMVEPDQHFGVWLSNPTNASLVGSPKVLKDTVTLLNDDLPAMSANTVTAGEGSNTTITFKIAQVYYQPITINITTQNGSAVAPGDYGTPSASSITIPGTAGHLSATVSVPVNTDHVVEAREFFTVTGSSIDGSVTGRVNIPKNST